MMKKVHIWVALFVLLPLLSFSTHIVGGSLTYQYMGGSTYVVTLKLYRDCGPGTAGFPGNVTISVRGNNGATFNPSKDFNMPLVLVTNVPSNLDPCAVPPNPMPCVQEGIYTATVTNLPPNNPGGYHLYYQVCCRNGSVQNIVNPLNAGSSFYDYIPPSGNNSSAVFNAFPPLFICVNQPFSFNHAATDPNGDSLVYSLYQPYNNTPAPTFPGNTATFNPVTYTGGYTTNNPLGATPFSINPQTGLLTGTPGTLGQFVVGVMVKEYRNGVLISQTIRDFQFNVLNCPQPPPTLAVPNYTINNGCSAVLNATGVSSVSVTWNSIAPGVPGQYNSLLTCTAGCLSNTVTGLGNPPPFVDYLVCGLSTSCVGGTLCDTFRVTFNPTLSVSIVPLNPTICFGQNTITLTAIPAGGTPPYNYLWNNTVPTQTLSAGVGVHSIRLTDGTGCPPAFNSITVNSVTVPITANAGADRTVCVQSPTTTITGSITGATGGIWTGGNGTYSPANTTLNNMVYTPTAAEIAAGFVNLILTTTGNGGCPGDADTVRISYRNFTGVITATNVNISCFGLANGTGSVNVTGGATPYSYLWNSVPSQTSAVANGLGVGTYSVRITDAIGCRSSATITITQPTPLNASTSFTNPTCNGISNGTVAISVSGGTSPYTYSWGTTPGTNSVVANLPAGTYTSTVTDARGCVLTRTIALVQPPPLSITFSVSNVSCFGGNNAGITTTVTGGTGAYTYSWSPAGGTGSFISGMPAGTYSLIVRDVNNCSIASSTTITQPTLLQVTTTATMETCSYSNNGQIQAVASGGTPTYTYSWQPGSLNGATISNLSAGMYTLTLTDNKGCQTNTLVTITEPAVLTGSVVNSTNISCFGGNNGMIVINATGGTPAYTYTWQPNVSVGNSATGLTSGTYSITIRDNRTCTTQVVHTLTQPTAPLSITANSSSVSCNGGTNGSVSSIATGGTAPYTYLWSPIGINGQNVSNIGAGNYSILLTDANGCTATNTTIINQPPAIGLTLNAQNSTCTQANGQATVSVSGGLPPYNYQWSPIGGINPIATGLPAGSYSVTVTDGNGCVVVGSTLINDNAGPTASILTTTNVSCFGGNTGAATVGVAGGIGPFSFSWQPTGQTTQTAINLTAGTYVVTVTDASTGCQSLATTSPAITEPTQIQIAISKTDVSCFGGNNGTAVATASGGNSSTYSYTWQPGGTTGTTLNNAIAGTYTVTVQDGNNCTMTQTVTINQPTPLAVVITTLTNVSCFGGANGSAVAGVTGGTAPYFYNWSTGSVASNAVGLAAGSLSVTVTDNKGCTASTATSVAQPAFALSVSLTSTAVSCFGGNDGIAMANPSGGTAGYTYNWSPNSSTSQTLTNVGAGPKLVIVTDANGCSANGFITVNQPSAITATIVTTNPTCGNSNGMLSAIVSGGNAPYTYTWIPTNSNAPSIINLSPGSYNINITDAKNCTASYSSSIVNISGPLLSLISSSNTSCFGSTNGLAFVSATAGTAPYSYNWFPYGGNAAAASNLGAGNYTCTVFDANNCSATIGVTITQPTPINLAVTSQTQPSCFGGNNGSMTANATGGTSTITYSWSPIGGNSATATNLTAGIYTVTATDANGCKTIITSQLQQPTLLSGNIISQTNPTCFNVGNGAINTGVVGGTPPYQFTWQTVPVQLGTQATNLVAGTYSVIITDNNSCATTVSATLTQPSQVITGTGTGATICLGQNGVISTSASGGSGNYYYYWSPVTPGNTASETVSPLSNTDYTVTGYDQNGCAGTSSIVHVEVYSLTQSNINVFGNSPICPGQAVVVYAEANGNTGPLTYSWNQGLGSGPGSFIVTPAVPTTYVATVTSVCGNSVIDSVQILFNPPPTISLTTAGSTACAPGAISFIDNSVSGNPNDQLNTWLWNFGDGTTSNQQNPTHVYTTPGTYVVNLTVTTDAGCTNNNTTSPLTVTLNPVPNASFIVNSNHLNIPFDILQCSNQSTGAISYVWNFGDGATSTAINPKHLYSNLGTFDVELIATNQFGCKDTAELKVTTVTEIKIPTAFTPNENGPTSGNYDINSLTNDIFFPYTSGVNKFHFTIFNRWGELIFESFDLKQGWDGYYRGKLCQEGVYVWKIDLEWENGRTFTKVGDVTLLR